MKYLLIDDLAESGWKTILEKAVIKERGSLDIATSFNDAVEKIKTLWDVIFLDLRLTEQDHIVANIEDYSGFKILKEIRKGFHEINFCTPIILFTASNKIWNIEALRDNGIDGFYIKEHPDYRFDKKTSRQNLENLQASFLDFKTNGIKRREIWELCNSIISKLGDHSYFKTQDKRYSNIKQRIIDKVRLGYLQLFKSQTNIEKNIFPSYNESFSFITFWSILEEIAKGFSDISETWDSNYKRSTNWKFRNSEYFIERNRDKIVLNFFRDRNFKKKFISYDSSTSESIKYSGDLAINLSEQIYSLLAAYSADDASFQRLCNCFRPLNKFRNDNDFIHSSILNIATKKLVTENAIENAYEKNKEILEFIKIILNLNIKK